MKVSWNEFHQYTLNLIHKIKKDKFFPEAIVVVANSGLVPAVIVAKAFNIKRIELITISSFIKNSRRKKPVLITSNLSSYLKNKKVLCLDDIVATGMTFKIAKKEIKKFNPKEIRFAACVVSQYVCRTYPDYWGESILRAANDLIHLPWDFSHKIM